MPRSSTETNGQHRNSPQEIIELLPFLRVYARAVNSSVEDADILVEQALAEAVTKVGDIDSGVDVKLWLFRILRNRCRVQNENSDTINSGFQRSPAISARSSTKSEGLLQAFRHLAQSEREILTLIEAMEFTHDEAAKVCDCSIQTVKSRLYHARERLSEKLNE